MTDSILLDLGDFDWSDKVDESNPTNSHMVPFNTPCHNHTDPCTGQTFDHQIDTHTTFD